MPRKVVEVKAIEGLIDLKVDAAHEKAARFRRLGNEAGAKDMEARASAMLAVKQHLKFCQIFEVE